ncbi:MAG TPA: nucleotidyltransferase domain-containing protein [Thermoleophilaceae bacterium]|nr:nucleotidyltransferase domain-containing protein [Thermoleophilaceae bacterium]
MGRALGHTAAAVDFSERTLRRYVNDGLLKARHVGRQVELAAHEERYLRSHHELLRTLRGALRTERNVQLAVLFGSTATGEDSEESDVDLMVSLHDARSRSPASLRRRLQTRLNRRVHLVVLHDAREAPSLLADILAEGRVVIDRGNLWPQLIDQRDLIAERAARADFELMTRAAASLSAARQRVAE